MSFTDLGLCPELLRAVSEKSYSEPTPIQTNAIPAVLAGRDVLAAAQTGTGKTAAFVLPILQRLRASTPMSVPPPMPAPGPGSTHAAARGGPPSGAPRALVLAPTRELAAQIADSARAYGKHTRCRIAVVFGGVSINPQIEALRAGCDLLVATPGRLLDLADQRAVDLRAVQCLVLDEADRMLDMGFIHSIRRVIRLLPAERQNLLFSATYGEEIRALARTILRDPVMVEVAARNAAAERVEQEVYRVPKEHKRHLLAHLIECGSWHQVLVFTRTKHGANRLTRQLEASGIRAAAIHGNKSQAARVRALADFKANEVTALVATEVAARGLDIKELPQVVNYELPNVPEDYVHRIGRTARAGAAGRAVSLVSPDETPLLRDIEKLLNRRLPVAALPQYRITSEGAAGAAAAAGSDGAAAAAGSSRAAGSNRDTGANGAAGPNRNTGSNRAAESAGSHRGGRSDRDPRADRAASRPGRPSSGGRQWAAPRRAR